VSCIIAKFPAADKAGHAALSNRARAAITEVPATTERRWSCVSLSIAAVAGIHELDRHLFRGVRRVKCIHGHAPVW